MIPYLKYYKKFLLKNREFIKDPKKVLIERSNLNEPFIFIKHDVECNLNRAYEMSLIESRIGIHSIWLLQKALLVTENIPLLKKMISKGHIIGYHYDVLDSNEGNFSKALEEFELVNNWFNQNLCNLKYVCPHGNPSKMRLGYNSNKDFWLKFSKKFDSLYDLVLDFDGHFYSDVSYGFYKIERFGKEKNKEKKHKVDFLNSKFTKCSLISLHSHRWTSNIIISIYKLLLFKLIKKIYFFLKEIKIFKIIGNKFYFLTKNI